MSRREPALFADSARHRRELFEEVGVRSVAHAQCHFVYANMLRSSVL